MSVSTTLLEEVALEGLDGITLDTLWYRLDHAKPVFPIKLDNKSKEFIWRAIVSLKEVEFYMLPEDRPVYREIVYEERDFGTQIYAPHPAIQIYPCKLVNKNGIIGSCATYDTRIHITQQVRSPDFTPIKTIGEVVEAWGDKLVMVASQRVRNDVLFRDAADPFVAQQKIINTMYLYIEHIGRCRYKGLNGTDAMSHLAQDSKVSHGHMGYLRKKLHQLGLTLKTNILMMRPTNRPNAQHQTRMSHDNLSYLKRFYAPEDSVCLQFHISLENHLLQQPGRKEIVVNMCETLEIPYRRTARFLRLRKNYFDLSYPTPAERSRTSTPQPSVKNDNVSAPASPDGPSTASVKSADLSEMDTSVFDSVGDSVMLDDTMDMSESTPSKKKNKQKRERRIPMLTVTLARLVEEDDKEEDIDEDENENDAQGEITPEVSSSADNIIRTDKPLLVQLADYVDTLGPQGATRNMIRDRFRLHTLQARQMMKIVRKKDIFHFFYQDDHRQKVERMCSNKFAKSHQPDMSAVLSSIPPLFQGSTSESPASSRPVSPFTPIEKGMTGRSMERNQLVIGHTLKNRLILFADLYRLIADSEQGRYNTQLDRKSLKRMVEKLGKAGHVTLNQTTVTVGSKSRDLFYICEPNMAIDDPLLQQNLEHQRSEIAASLTLAGSKAAAKKDGNADTTSTSEIKVESFKEQLSFKYDTSVAALRYGYASKMKRAETVHQFLCYVLYNYEGVVDPADKPSIQQPSANGEVSKVKVYLNDKSWKRFIPPDILRDDTRGSGVANLLDLGTQLPLCVFLTIIKLSYDVPPIKVLLDDPIKRLLPVRHLPLEVQSALLFRKKHLLALREVMGLLCMMGLASNTTMVGEGSGIYKEMMRIYVHKKGALIDTSDYGDLSSLIVYNLCESMYQVESFWMNLRTVCLATRVTRNTGKPINDGGRNKHSTMKLRPGLKEAVEPKLSIAEIVEGEIPGDGLGAGGLDSSFFAHLSRQWTSCFAKVVPNPIKPTSLRKRLTNASSIEEKKKLLSLESAINIEPKIVSADIRQASVSKKRRIFTADNSKGAKQRKLQEKTAKKKGPKKKKGGPADELDLQAQARLETQRSSWAPVEDSMLVLCKVALLILGTKDLASVAVRDTLHKYVPRSRDKSSAAAARRLQRIVKMTNCQHSIGLYHQMALKFKNIENYLSKESSSESSTFSQAFADLISILADRFGSSVMDDVLEIDLQVTGSVQALRHRYDIIPSVTRTQDEDIVHWAEPTTDNEIAKSTLHNFIIGYLLLSDDKTSRSYQMHKVFEQYPPLMTDEVLKTLRENKVVILKNKEKTNMKRFTLSHKYSLFMERLQILSLSNYTDSGQALAQLCLSGEVIPIESFEEGKGQLISLASLAFIGAVKVEFDLPERVLDITDIDQTMSDPPDNEDDDEDDDDEMIKARAMQYEHCSIKPCKVKYHLNTDMPLPDALIGEAIQDKRYIRHLMKQIPFEVDVEAVLAGLSKDTNSPYHRLYSRIDQSSTLGVLLKDLNHDEKVYVADLVEAELVIQVGMTKRRLVSHQNSRMWCVHALKDTKGRGTGIPLTDQDKIQLSCEDNNLLEEEQEQQEALFDDNDTPRSTYHRVDIIPRPWMTPEGTVNYKLLFSLLSAVMSVILNMQGIKVSSLQNKFSMCYCPVALLELIDILIDIGCVKNIYVKKQTKASLFSNRPSIITSDDEMVGDDVTTHLIASNECILRLGQFMNNTKQVH